MAQSKVSLYEEKKATLIKKLSEINQSEQAIYLKKSTSNLFRHRHPQNHGMDVSFFSEVINIDKKSLVADVEGMTTYENLVKECLRHNCLPTVVPELKTITIGGALTGCGIESSSFKYGLVHETILDFEVLLSSGQVIKVAPESEYKDLFYGFPNSYGTLGYALRAKVKLYPIKPFVKLSHLHFSDRQAFFSALHSLCITNRSKGNIAFIEGVFFDKDDLIISVGEFVETCPYVSDYSHKNIYYKSLNSRQEDYLTTADYIWRWDTDWFWCSKFFGLQNPLLRRLVGKKYLNSQTYWRLRRYFAQNKLAKYFYSIFSKPTESLIQDVQIPIENAQEFLNFFEEKIAIKPVWLCPTMPYQYGRNFDLYPLDADKLYINFGFWDVLPLHEHEGFYNRLIEKKVQELGGKKSLYSNVYYTQEEFWNIYNKDSYDKLKHKYDPDNRLRNLYEKCHDRIV